MLIAEDVVPKPEFDLVPVFKPLGDVVQADPFQVSVAVDGPGASPPNAMAASDVPDAPKVFLAVFKSATSDQVEPLYCSVSLLKSADGVRPPTFKAAF